jgi:quercetin dioxygenase-like cupin family protein
VSHSFISSMQVKREEAEWGSLAWFSSPAVSNARNLVVIEVALNPGGAHSFHKHPKQEEVIYVIEGEIEEWVDGEKRTLRPGDSAFIAAGVVHASFNRIRQSKYRVDDERITGLPRRQASVR